MPLQSAQPRICRRETSWGSEYMEDRLFHEVIAVCPMSWNQARTQTAYCIPPSVTNHNCFYPDINQHPSPAFCAMLVGSWKKLWS